MADSNPQRRAESIEFLDDDPFAELTRIMGHDPRSEEKASAVPPRSEVPVAPAPVSAEPAHAPGVANDLETELFADLDFSEFDDAPAAPDWRTPETAEPVAFAQAAAPVDEVSAEDLPVDIDLDLEMTGWEYEAAAEAAPAPAG